MRKTTNLDAARCELVSARRLDAAFPFSAAAEPVARGGNTGGVTVVHGGERQRESPRPGESVEPRRDAERYSHQANGGAGEKPGRIVACEERKPWQEKPKQQAKAPDGGSTQSIVYTSES